MPCAQYAAKRYSIGDLFGTDSVTVKINGGSPITFGSNHSESIQVYEGQPFSFEVSDIPARYSGCTSTNNSISEVAEVISATIDCTLITRGVSVFLEGTYKSLPVNITATVDEMPFDGITPTIFGFLLDNVPNGDLAIKLDSNNENYCYMDTPSSSSFTEINVTCDDSLVLKSLGMEDALYECVSDNDTLKFVDEVNTSLACNNEGITELTGIGALTHLTDLELKNNQLSDDDFDQPNYKITLRPYGGSWPNLGARSIIIRKSGGITTVRIYDASKFNYTDYSQFSTELASIIESKLQFNSTLSDQEFIDALSDGLNHTFAKRDPIYALANTVKLDLDGNYDIRLINNCDYIFDRFTNPTYNDDHCAGPDRFITFKLGLSSPASNYLSHIGNITLEDVRKHGRINDTFHDIGPLSWDGDRENFSPVRDGSFATVNFGSIRDSLECDLKSSNNNTVTFLSDLTVEVECQAKQSVDIEVTLEGGGYDDSGRENESVSGIELVYPTVAKPFDDANMSSKVGDDWQPGQNITFFDFPANEEHVSVWPGYGSSNSFSAPTGVYCDESIELTVDDNNRNFVLPCRQHTLLEKVLPPLVDVTDTGLFADTRQYYALSVNSTLEDIELSFPINTSGNTSFFISQQTSATVQNVPPANPQINQEINVTENTQIFDISQGTFSQSGDYFVGLLNNTGDPITADISVTLNDELSKQATFRPLLNVDQVSSSWGITQGSVTDTSSRFNDYVYNLEIRSSGGSDYDKSGAFVRLSLTSPSVDTYLLLTREFSREIIALNDDAGRVNRSVIFKALEPGNYRIYVSTYSPTNSSNSTEEFTLTVDSSMPAFTTLN